MLDFSFTLTGLLVGFLVGLTGIGGGSLMTPILIMGFGIPPATAVGTDLVMAFVTKFSGLWSYFRKKAIDWKVTASLFAGSLPGSIVALTWLKQSPDVMKAHGLITSALGVALVLTALVLIFSKQLRAKLQHLPLLNLTGRRKVALTAFFGFLLGVLVTLSSVGAGALGTVLLLWFYPQLSMTTVVGTDLAHAILLTGVAGLGHAKMGTVDVPLLLSLLAGSLPGVWLGAQTGLKVPEVWVRRSLAGILMVVGVKVLI